VAVSGILSTPVADFSTFTMSRHSGWKTVLFFPASQKKYRHKMQIRGNKAKQSNKTKQSKTKQSKMRRTIHGDASEQLGGADRDLDVLAVGQVHELLRDVLANVALDQIYFVKPRQAS
jgi:hypothetical protein